MQPSRMHHVGLPTPFLGIKTIEPHIKPIFRKLDLAPAPDDQRVYAPCFAYLRSH
jgi:hypothetical protein